MIVPTTLNLLLILRAMVLNSRIVRSHKPGRG